MITGLAAVCAAMAAPACRQPAPLLLVERFIPANCERCWQQPSAALPPHAMVLDWIVPTLDDAALAAAAVPDAIARAASAPSSGIRSMDGRTPLTLRVADGPAWNGYVAVQLSVTRRTAWPAGSTAWLALVERVPAGSEGSGADRQLVREVVGPLPLDELATLKTVRHLRAIGLPVNAKPEWLASAGWVESADGRVIAATQSPAAGCSGPR